MSDLSDWSRYRAQILKERDQGKLTALEAQAQIEAKYEAIYGIDPTMEGAFAYGIKLFEEADIGDLTMHEADTLAQARIDDVIAHRGPSLPLYVFPPEASD
jgi:hypothetical protein